MHIDDKTIERFSAKVNRDGPNGCHIWLGTKNKLGYGLFRVPKRSSMMLAHRFAWQQVNGPIPDGMCVMHIVCDNPSCVNPQHLAIGTVAQNNADMVQKGRQQRGDRHYARTHPEKLVALRGEKHGSAKLTDAQVSNIRQLAETGAYSKCELGRMFGVSDVQIANIVNGKSRKSKWSDPQFEAWRRQKWEDAR